MPRSHATRKTAPETVGRFRGQLRKSTSLCVTASIKVAAQIFQTTACRGISMLRVNPFAALRPRPEVAAEVAAVPYDVVNAAEARKLAEGRPLSFLHISRSEIDLPASTDPYADEVYEKAQQNLERFKREVFLREAAPSIYLYRQE